MNTRNRILQYIAVYKSKLIFAALCGLVMTGCTLFTTTLAKWFVDTSTNKGSVLDNPIIQYGLRHEWWTANQAPFTLIWVVAILAIVVSIPNGIFTFLNNYLIASVTNRIGTDLRRDIYSHIQSLPLRFFHKSRVGDIMSRMSYDVGLIQNSSQIVMQAIDGPLKIVGCMAYMFKVSWQLTLVTLIFVPTMGIAIDKLTKKLRSLTKSTQERLADTSAVIEESIRGIRIIKSFAMEDPEIKRFNRVNNNSLSASLKAARRGALVLPSIEVMGSASVSLIMLCGGWMMTHDQLSFGHLIQFALLTFQVAAAAKSFGRLNVLYQQVMGAAERVFEVLDTRSDLPEDPNGVILKNVQGSVEFKNVDFEYNPGEIVLDDLSFKINPGEIVAIVGPSGAGKSTIADLIPRFYEVIGGQILVEGNDVRNIKTSSLREHIAMVPQETILFSGSIADNISYGKPGAGKEEIVYAAKAANADEFVSQLPSGYDTVLGEGGVGLSGGQRQRIAIARALLKNPKILILDEATSSLDAASEGVVQDALDRLMRGRSTLVIAHRLSTVTNADRIIVMDKGRVVESGSFEELVSTGGLFSQLYKTQFKSEEVE